VLDQLPRISFAASTTLATKVDEVVAVVSTLAENVMEGIVEKRHKFIVPTLFPFRRKLVPESP
jgi:hypothetical protein